MLTGILGCFTFVGEYIAQDAESLKDASERIPTLTKDLALALVKSTWGDCTPSECARVTVSVVKQKSGTYLVTATYEGLRDDSISDSRRAAVASYDDGKWVLGKSTGTFRCQPRRGHQNFSSEPCY